jgi:tRNA threonylcarbamoyladenosine biosynthesis protein TsaE
MSDKMPMHDLKQGQRSRSPQETEAIAARFAASLRPGAVTALHGDLGAGKTVFARGVARALGIAEPVTSPTFTLVQEYEVPGAPHGIRRLCHLDLYRIETPEAAGEFGIDDYLDADDTVLLVEWPERLGGCLPDHARHVHLRHDGPEEREIDIDA